MPTPADRLRTVRRSESGQAMVELALILPLLALIVFGGIDFARALGHWTDMNQMASVGARTAAVNKDVGAELQDWVLDLGDTDFVRDNATVEVCHPDGTDEIGDSVKVTVSAPYSFLGILDIGTVTISGSATMRMEARPTNYTADGC